MDPVTLANSWYSCCVPTHALVKASIEAFGGLIPLMDLYPTASENPSHQPTQLRNPYQNLKYKWCVSSDKAEEKMYWYNKS